MKRKRLLSTIEEDILTLQKQGKDRALSINEIRSILAGKWQLLILLFLSLPFCLPIQIPGLSTPFGIAIAFIGLKMSFRKYAWLPKRILDKTIAPHTIEKITNQVLWLVRKVKHLIYPRLSWICEYPSSRVLNGLLIAALGLFLALPLPIPLSNLVAAWAIFLMVLGLLEEDGLFVLAGYLLSILTFAIFVATILIIKNTFHHYHHH